MNKFNFMKLKLFHKDYYRYGKIITSLFICIFMMMFFSEKAMASSYNITNYDKAIVVNANNTFDVTISITIRPLEDQLSFDYMIPTRSENGNKILLSDINVKNAEYKKQTQKNYSIITITDDKSITTKTYTITYKLDFGEDYIKDQDSVHMNILPSDIDSTISNLSFSIIMPFDYSYNNMKLTVFNSQNDSTQDLNIMKDIKYTYNRESRVFSATCNKKLNYKEGLKLDLILPEGYFKDERNNSVFSTITIIISMVSTIALVMYFFTLGRDEEILCGKSSRFLEDMSPAYIVVLLRNLKEKNLEDEKIDNIYEIFTPMILYWANKGYISIKENCVNSLNGDKNMIIVRNTNVDTSYIPIYERILLEGIFRLGVNDIVDFKVLKNGIITNDEVYRQKIAEFFEYIKAFKEQLNDLVYKKLESGSSNELNRAYDILRFVPIIVLNIFSLFTLIQDYTIISDVLYPAIYLILSIVLVNMAKKYKDNYVLYSIASMIGLFIIGFGLKIQIIPYLLISITTLLHIVVRKHNFDLMSQLKQIYAFASFIKQNDRKILVDELSANDLYFYQAFPYAMSLGLKDKWISNCNDFRVRTPDWYIKNKESQKNLYVQNMDKFIEEFTDFGEFLYANIYNK